MNQRGIASLIGLIVTLAIICWLVFHYFRVRSKFQSIQSDAMSESASMSTKSSPQALMDTADQTVRDYNKAARERADQLDQAAK